MNFGKCVHLCNKLQNIFIAPETSLLPLFSQPHPHIQSQATTDLFLSLQIRFVVLEFHINRVIKVCTLLCWASFVQHVLEIFPYHFVPLWLILFINEYCSIVHIYHNLFISSTLDGHWDSSSLGLNKTATMNIHVQVFAWKYVFMGGAVNTQEWSCWVVW